MKTFHNLTESAFSEQLRNLKATRNVIRWNAVAVTENLEGILNMRRNYCELAEV
jgi:hypothetical protein